LEVFKKFFCPKMLRPPPEQSNNSGSEANDMAAAMIRVASGKNDIYCLRNGYHGMGAGAGGLTSHHTWRHEQGLMTGVKHVQCPGVVRG
jgi:4-aminobutyrate aminotransferase-like enzyme